MPSKRKLPKYLPFGANPNKRAESFKSIVQDLERGIVEKDRVDYPEQWEAFCSFVHSSDWWGTSAELVEGWYFFLAGALWRG